MSLGDSKRHVNFSTRKFLSVEFLLRDLYRSRIHLREISLTRIPLRGIPLSRIPLREFLFEEFSTGNFVVEKVGVDFRSWKYRWEISHFFSHFLKFSEYFLKSFASVGNYFLNRSVFFFRRSTQLVESCSKTQLSSKMVQTISRYGHFSKIFKNVTSIAPNRLGFGHKPRHGGSRLLLLPNRYLTRLVNLRT